MSHRLGTCSSCNAQYKVPASFKADRAKCKSCGGVVEIGPVGGGAPKAAAKPAPAAKPAAKPVPARPVAAKPPAKPAPKPVAEEKDSVRVAAQAAADRVREAGRKSDAEPTKARAGSRAGAKAGARGSKARGGSGGSSSRRGSRTSKKKEASKTPLLAAVAVLLVAGGGAAWFLTRGDDAGPQAAEKGTEVAEAPEAAATETPEAEAPAEAAPEPEPEAAAGEGEGDGEAAAPEETPEPEAKPAPALDDIDLSVIPDEPKLPGTSDEDWASLQEWTTEFFDPNAGAAGNRARAKMMERGREAFPAVLNAMKDLDLSTEAGFRAGDLGQRFLMDVCNGTNFGWKYDRDESGALTTETIVFNKKVVRSWITIAWAQGRESPKAWAKITKTEEADAIELFKVTGPFEGLDEAGDESEEAASASSALDDL